jgi:putative FmdB family regulatory protein
MPTYQYRCTECGAELEAVQKFSDEPLTVCPECSGRLRKVFNAVGVVFKGSGFYATDSRKPRHGAAKPNTESSDTSAKTEAKPAAKPSSTEKTPAA